jgi:hypothetical protein
MSKLCSVFVLPLLEIVQELSKFVQGCQTFICDLVATFKLCEANLQEMYCEPNTRFSPKHFSLFLELFEHINDKCLTWWKELASQVEYATFFIGSKLYMFHVTNQTTCVISLVSKEVWAETIHFLKE